MGFPLVPWCLAMRRSRGMGGLALIKVAVAAEIKVAVAAEIKVAVAAE